MATPLSMIGVGENVGMQVIGAADALKAMVGLAGVTTLLAGEISLGASLLPRLFPRTI